MKIYGENKIQTNTREKRNELEWNGTRKKYRKNIILKKNEVYDRKYVRKVIHKNNTNTKRSTEALKTTNTAYCKVQSELLREEER